MLFLSWKKAGPKFALSVTTTIMWHAWANHSLCFTAWLHPFWTCLSFRSLSCPKTTVIRGNVHIHTQAHTFVSKESSQLQQAVWALLVKQTEISLNVLPDHLGKSTRNTVEDWKHLLSPTGQEKGIKQRILSNKKVN